MNQRAIYIGPTVTINGIFLNVGMTGDIRLHASGPIVTEFFLPDGKEQAIKLPAEFLYYAQA